MKSRILCIGDIHLGNRTTRLPSNIGEYGIDPSELTPAATWRAAVSWAVAHDIEAVLLSGDVIENDRDRFEAYGHLKWGVEELLASRIPVFAVAGNHDWMALPRLSDQIPAFRLLGRDGKWEVVEIDLKNGTRIRIAGWSFRDRYYRKNPIRELSLTRDSDLPTLGLLHCDLDASGSPYAPVSSRDLEEVPVDAWFLGHIHRPSPLSGPRPIGYLGSLSGLNPGEPGPHGAWLATVNGPGDVQIELLPLSRLRWEALEVAIDGVEGSDPEDLKDALFSLMRRAIGRAHEDVVASPIRPRVGGCRLRLTGRTASHHRIRTLARSLVFPQETLGDTHYFIEKVIDEGAPALDLAGLAEGSDPPAALARLLDEIIERKGRAGELIAAARGSFGRTTANSRWSRLRRNPPATDDEIRRILVTAGFEALEELLAQQGEGEVRGRQ
ncbi:MAG: DNA repair exonuclease [Candidatus Euphemobacter frigidus]|nr:DNA repair exonuclease [Candidatus Euphemobacter frigidus]MDP8274824.1 DNA repair exonuclease [Candidatus Euphemobacter frigidus]